jgi:hypothetical protein
MLPNCDNSGARSGRWTVSFAAFVDNFSVKERVFNAIEHFATQGDGKRFLFVRRVAFYRLVAWRRTMALATRMPRSTRPHGDCASLSLETPRYSASIVAGSRCARITGRPRRSCAR